MAKRARNTVRKAALVDTASIKVRFSEVDSLRIVWHGEYVKYFEDGREAFGKRYGISYSDIHQNGYTAPIVELSCQYKQSLTFGEEAIVETRYIATDAAKIVFDFIVYRTDGKTVVATGSTTQVFINAQNELELVNPAFYIAWKKKWGVE